MANAVGFRDVKVLEDVTEGKIDDHGSYLYIEVTNDNAQVVKFYPNNFVQQGHPNVAPSGMGIPIPAGTTRQIPMALYNFTASAPVTVVAYKM